MRALLCLLLVAGAIFADTMCATAASEANGLHYDVFQQGHHPSAVKPAPYNKATSAAETMATSKPFNARTGSSSAHVDSQQQMPQDEPAVVASTASSTETTAADSKGAASKHSATSLDGPPSSPAALAARLPGASSKRQAGANASAEQSAESLPRPSITHVRRAGGRHLAQCAYVPVPVFPRGNASNQSVADGGNSNDNRGSWIVWVVLGGVCLLALLAVLCFYLYHRRQEARRRKREEENAAALAWAEAYSQRHTVFVEQPDSRVDVAFTTEGAFTRDGLHQAA